MKGDAELNGLGAPVDPVVDLASLVTWHGWGRVPMTRRVGTQGDKSVNHHDYRVTKVCRALCWTFVCFIIITWCLRVWSHVWSRMFLPISVRNCSYYHSLQSISKKSLQLWVDVSKYGMSWIFGAIRSFAERTRWRKMEFCFYSDGEEGSNEISFATKTSCTHT